MNNTILREEKVSVTETEIVWSEESLKEAKKIFQIYHFRQDDKPIYTKKIRKYFFNPFHKMVLDRITLPEIKEFLTMEIYDLHKENKTVLHRISHVICKCYVEESLDNALITINKLHFEKLKAPASKIITHLEYLQDVLKDFITIKFSHNPAQKEILVLFFEKE